MILYFEENDVPASLPTNVVDLLATSKNSLGQIREYEAKIEQLRGIIKCGHCGSVIDPEAKFCSNCGNPLTPPAPVQEQPIIIVASEPKEDCEEIVESTEDLEQELVDESEE